MKRIIKLQKEIFFHSFAAVGGYEELRGPLGEAFDYCDESNKFRQKTWEMAEAEMARLALNFALTKGNVDHKNVDFLIGGDLQNQCVATSIGLSSFSIPYLGIYGACSTCTEGLLIASMLLQAEDFSLGAAVTSSHNSAAERQFRSPLEYGGQRTTTAQWTATAAGAFILSKEKSKAAITEVMIGKIDIHDALIQTEIASMHMIPSHINLVGAEIEMLESQNRESVLKEKIGQLKDEYDFIIIDCSPSLGLITVNSLTAADSVIIPVQPEFFALEGLGKLLQTIRLVQGGLNPSLTIEGFVVTMFDGRTKVHNQVLGELREHFKDMVFDTIIQRNIRLSEAPSHGKPIILYDVICNGTSNYLNLAKEVLEKNGYQVTKN